VLLLQEAECKKRLRKNEALQEERSGNSKSDKPKQNASRGHLNIVSLQDSDESVESNTISLSLLSVEHSCLDSTVGSQLDVKGLNKGVEQSGPLDTFPALEMNTATRVRLIKRQARML
jgi:hypothetical protein